MLTTDLSDGAKRRAMIAEARNRPVVLQETRIDLAGIAPALPPIPDERAQYSWLKSQAASPAVGQGCWLASTLHCLARDSAIRLVAQQVYLLQRSTTLATHIAHLLSTDAERETHFTALIDAAKRTGNVRQEKDAVTGRAGNWVGELCLSELRALLIRACVALDPQFPPLHRLLATESHAVIHAPPRSNTKAYGHGLAYTIAHHSTGNQVGVPALPPPTITVMLTDGDDVARPVFDPTAGVPVQTLAGVYTYRPAYVVLAHGADDAHGHFAVHTPNANLDTNPHSPYAWPVELKQHAYLQDNSKHGWAAIGLVLATA